MMRAWTCCIGRRLRAGVFALGAAAAFLSSGGCAFGTEASALEEDSVFLSTWLTTLGSYSGGTVDLRFGDGGSDAIDQFNSGAVALQLNTASWIEIDRVDLIISPANILGVSAASAANIAADPSAAGGDDLASVLHEHEESAPAPGGAVRVSVIGPYFVQFLSAGATPAALDSLDRRFFSPGAIAFRGAPGRLTSVTVHVSRRSFSGTAGAAAFSVLDAQAADFTLSLRCPLTLSPTAQPNLRLFIDYSVLFRDMAAASASEASAAIARNRNAVDFVKEAECFTF